MTRLTDEQKAKLGSLYWQENKTLPEIAKMFGVSYPAIRMWFIKLDIPRRSRSIAQLVSNGTDKITCEMLRRLYIEEQKSQSEISLLLNRSRAGIGLLLRRCNISARSKSNPGPRNGMFGRTHTPEARAKISAAVRRQFSTQEARDRQAEITAKQIAAGRTGKTHNKLETLFASILDDLSIEYTWQYRLGRYSYDFYLPKINALIETHGTFWHADPRFYSRDNLSEIQQHNAINDKLKATFAQKSGYKLLHFWEYDIHNNPEKIRASLA
jgi:very-short-patch-repair endonuclease